MKFNDRYLIKTKNGFKKFDGIKKSDETSGLEISFSDQSVVRCTYTHRIEKDGKFVFSKDIKIGDVFGSKKVINIKKIFNHKFFDPVNVQDGNTYSFNGLEHHNCAVLVVDELAFIDSKNWEAMADSVLPSQSALAWKKNIFISTANGMNHFYDIVNGARTHKKLRDLDGSEEIQLNNGKIVSLAEFYEMKNKC